MLYLAGLVITFFLAIILLTKKGKTAADNVLAAWLFIIGFHLLLFYLHITGEIYDHSFLLGIHMPMPLFHGPFLYLYTLTATHDRISYKYGWHFLPPLITFAVLMEFFLLPDDEKLSVYRSGGVGFEIYTKSIFFAIIISGFVYVILSFKELRQYKKRIAEEFSNTERINLNWLRYLIYSILGIWLLVALNGIDAWIFGAVVIFVLLLGYFGIKHVGIFTYQREVTHEKPVVDTLTERQPEPEKILRYERSGLQKDTAEAIHRALQDLMEREKLFKNAELSLSELAERLDAHPNNLSQVINSYENKNFYDYINTRRIEEFKTLVRQPENSRYTLLSLAFEVGFNSKTSFNRNFRKITGLSPTAWLKQANVHLQRD